MGRSFSQNQPSCMHSSPNPSFATSLSVPPCHPPFFCESHAADSAAGCCSCRLRGSAGTSRVWREGRGPTPWSVPERTLQRSTIQRVRTLALVVLWERADLSGGRCRFRGMRRWGGAWLIRAMPTPSGGGCSSRSSTRLQSSTTCTARRSGCMTTEFFVFFRLYRYCGGIRSHSSRLCVADVYI